MPKKRDQRSSPFHSAEEEDREEDPSAPYPAEYKLAVADRDFLLREEVRPVRLQLEYLRPQLVLRDQGIDETVVFFGSARIPEEHIAEERHAFAREASAKQPDDIDLQRKLKISERVLENSAYIKEATKLAHIISVDERSNFVVVTGGGPGFMAAANRGAYQAKAPSVSLGVILPNEQKPNPYVTPELTFQFHYFAIRKMHFLTRAKALVAFPGGYGTLDEVFETLMLIQTKKIDPIPLLLVGKKFWTSTINFEAFVENGTISPEDLELFQYVETAEEAWEIITGFYGL